MKRKEYNEVTNKIVNIDTVLARGQREPVFELTFKTSGYNRMEGHRVYIDYKCAKELITKLNSNINNIESQFFPNEFYERIHRSSDKMFL